jgi:DNA-directed RNA polymerase subunit RPC12/RpoP
MVRQRFARKLNGEVELDLCFACQGIWFDEWESLQMAPGGVVELFRLIHEHRDDQRLPLADPLRCPQCGDRLLHALDKAKSGSFNYHRCLQQHGRFTTFAQFMIEKGFVRQLTGAEIDQLKARVDVVRCTSCGAPVDIKRDHACGHCRSPLAILDPAAVEQALATYHQAEVKRTTLDPEALADAILLTERDKSRRQRERGLLGDSFVERDIGDLLVSGVEIVWGMLKR